MRHKSVNSYSASASLLHAAREVLVNNVVEPAELLRMLLSIALLHFDVRIFYSKSRDLPFQDVLRLISKSFARFRDGGYPIETLSFCLHLCEKLNSRMGGFVPGDVMRTLQSLVRPSRRSEIIMVSSPTSSLSGWPTAQYAHGPFIVPEGMIPLPPPRIVSAQVYSGEL